MDIREIDLALVDDAPVNPNRMANAKYAALVSAIRRFGYLQPVIVEERGDGRFTMRDGHHRKRALLELGRASAPAVVVQPGDGAKAIMLALNGLRGELDLTASADIVAELHEAGWPVEDLDVTGFSEQEIRDLLAARHEPSPDEVLGGGVGAQPEAGPDDDAEGEDRGKLVLEVEFEDARLLRRAKRALRRAAGKGRPLYEGLVKALALEDG